MAKKSTPPWVKVDKIGHGERIGGVICICKDFSKSGVNRANNKKT